MKTQLMFAALFYFLPSISQSIDLSKYPVYRGTDLGLTYTSQKSFFRIWSPPANNAQLLLYKTGAGEETPEIISMKKSVNGTWTVSMPGDHKGRFYAFRVHINNKWFDAVPDPYAKAVGVNGKRGMIIDLSDTNPPGWKEDKSPLLVKVNDAIIYELHVRDASIDASSGVRLKGKFLGLTESGTVNANGLTTGLDHLKELGVTHIHLLPSYDFYSVDESKPGSSQYNWGYDPLNYNTTEGSYATKADDGVTRIKEFKQLVKTMHENGLNVVMDVVYNHTMLTENSYFNQLVPGYYYRQTADGKFSNATACNNETASERAMFRKFMVESVKYWVKEYHIDGFRFDLMGVHDIETMNLISKELHALKPGILLYGEGWTAGSSPLPDTLRALKANAYRLRDIAVFSDDVRDGIKGSVFENSDRGFASGKTGMEESIKFGIVAGCRHPQVDYSKVNYSKAPFAAKPSQTITYAECHDNHVLWDKLAISAPGATEAERKEMHKLALSIVLTSQGISFLHAGTEFLRTKKGHENSYNAGDSVNAINWNLKSLNKDVYDYTRKLITMRKTHVAFRMRTTDDLASHLVFTDGLPASVIAYTIDGAAVKDSWKKIRVILNGNETSQTITLDDSNWKIHLASRMITIGGRLAREGEGVKGDVTLAPFSCVVLYQ